MLDGTKTGGLAPTSNFCNVVLSTGEEPISQINTTTGVNSRCIEIEGSAFRDEKEASQMYKIAKNCHGTAGRVFIQNLIQQYGNTNYKELQQKLEELKQKLEEKSTANVGSYITAVAIVVLADILVSKWIFNENNEETSINMGVNILNTLVKAEDMDVTEKAYQYIKSYIVSHHNQFDELIKPDSYGPQFIPYMRCRDNSLGLYENGVYYVNLCVLENLMIQHKFQYRKIVYEFAKKGYITPAFNEDGTIKSLAIQKKYRKKNTRMFAFPIPDWEEISEDEKPLKVPISSLQEYLKETATSEV